MSLILRYSLTSSLIALMLLNGCGKRGDPSYKRFLIPQAVIKIEYLLRPEGLILRWQYPYPERSGLYFEIWRYEDKGFIKIGETTELTFIDKAVPQRDYLEYSIVSAFRDGLKRQTRVFIKVEPLPPSPAEFHYRIDEEGVNLSWRYEEGCLYNIYRRYIDGKEELLNSEPLQKAYILDSPDPGRTVFYRLRCRKGNTEGFFSEVRVSPEDYVPSRPEGLRYAIIDNRVVITWKENRERWVRGYRIYRILSDAPEFRGEVNYPLFVDELINGVATYEIRALGPVREGLPSERLQIKKPS